MNGKRRLGLVVVAIVLSSCAQAEDDAADQPADTTAAAATAGDPNGTWNMRAVPTSGSDTASTIFQVEVANGNWTLKLPDREPIAVTAVTDADSFIVDAGPYQSVRRQGLTVSTHSVYRINGDQITGNTTAHYRSAGADSVLQLNVTGTRVR